MRRKKPRPRLWSDGIETRHRRLKKRLKTVLRPRRSRTRVQPWLMLLFVIVSFLVNLTKAVNLQINDIPVLERGYLLFMYTLTHKTLQFAYIEKK